MPDPDLLSVEDLCIGIPGCDSGSARVDNLSFCLNQGEILGITGQSGSGKTLTAMALAGILPKPLAVRRGTVRFKGCPVLPEKRGGNSLVPGRDILMLFQSPSRALDPWVRIGVHLTDAIRAAIKAVIKAAGPPGHESPKETAVRALEKTGLDAAVYDRYPFELSGGQRQRCLMALALAVKPRILIADEPFTGQDDIHKSLVIKSIRDLTENEGTAVILISHDLRRLQGLVQNLVVIYNGRQIEAGPAREIIHAPCHDHTRELVRAMIFMEGGGR